MSVLRRRHSAHVLWIQRHSFLFFPFLNVSLWTLHEIRVKVNACHVSHRYQRGPRGHTARGCDKTSIMGEREWEWAGEICRFVATKLAGIGGIASTPLKNTKTCSKMKNNAFNLKWYIHDLQNAFKSGYICNGNTLQTCFFTVWQQRM